MDTSVGRRRVHRNIGYTEVDSDYQHDVSMYKFPPGNNISLNEFEELAVERLQMLRIVEEASIKGHRQYSEEWKKYIKEELAKQGLRRFLRLLGGYCSQTEQDVQARRADHISHFILKIAYCRSEDLRRWFLTREMELFKFRFLVQSQQGIMKFLQLNNLTYIPIPVEVKDKLRPDLYDSTPGVSERDFNSTDFYKVPFAEVLPLVKNRKVFVKKGYAYIPTNDVIVCIQTQFRASLSQSLSIYNQGLPNVDDERINNLLKNLHLIHTGNTFVVDENREGVHPANLDSYSKAHFPMCMNTIFNALKTSHHLKHGARLQLILFLKGIGLSYEDTMNFWRTEFTKHPQIDENKFEKTYSYTVRHSFGKAGSMTNYSPFSCIKIIMDSVGQGDIHGCPFKHWDANIMKQKLSGEYGLGAQSVNSIMEMVEKGHYQIACSKYFECTKGQAPPSMISHPNQFFTDSMNLVKQKQEPKKN